MQRALNLLVHLGVLSGMVDEKMLSKYVATGWCVVGKRGGSE